MMEATQQRINVPLEEWVTVIIERTVQNHAATCPVPGKLQKLEMKFSTFIGYVIGSGTCGGVIGSLFSKFVM